MSRFHTVLLAASLAASLTLAGCEGEPTLPDAPTKAPAGNQAAAPSIAAPSAPASTAPNSPTPPAAASQVAEGSPADDGSTEKARRGVGEKGSGYGGGIITEPVREYWLLREATVFEIQIPHGINLFHAEHNRFPKDMDEFKREILEPASIRLPELREGDKYIYDGKTGELLVQHPRTEADRAAMNQQ
jgi:hypothetical protein